MSDTFDITFDIRPALDLLRNVRSKVAAIQDTVRDEVKGSIRERVLDQTIKFIAPYPPRIGGDFVFATAKSRRWYIMARRKGWFEEQSTEYGPWQRTLNLQAGWTVELDPRTTRVNTIMRIANTAADDPHGGERGPAHYSQAVYGPDAVLGHAQNGWGDGFAAQIATITEGVELDLVEILQETMEDFIRV